MFVSIKTFCVADHVFPVDAKCLPRKRLKISLIIFVVYFYFKTLRAETALLREERFTKWLIFTKKSYCPEEKDKIALIIHLCLVSQ